MKAKRIDGKNFPIDFQREIINLAKGTLKISGARFALVNPEIHVKGFVSYNVDAESEELYQSQYAHLDPMHPSRFKDSDVTVICSDTMMTEQEWRQSVFYLNYMAPHHFDHDTDIFFRQNSEIVAVLSLLRNDSLGAFNEEELGMLRNMQPFMEYALNSVYQPKRFSERELFSDKYCLTKRELDVLEFAMAGHNNKTIANELNLSLPTVRTHLQHIYDKVGVHSTNELISRLFRELQ